MFLFLSGFPCAAGVQFRARDVKKHTLGLETYIKSGLYGIKVPYSGENSV